MPSEDNPLAEGLPDGETVDDLRAEGKQSDDASSEDSGDEGGGDEGGGDATEHQGD